jgi:CHAD domain-containing protein
MGYEFRSDESAAEGARRILAERLEESVAHLTKATGSRADEEIHNARKRIKEARSVLRLLKPSIGESFAAENGNLRLQASLLAPAREAAAHIEALDAIPQEEMSRRARVLLRSFRRELARDHRRAMKTTLRSRRIEQVQQTLGETARRFRTLPMRGEGFELFDEGVERIYRQTQQRMLEALEKRGHVAFHEWRKRAKDSLYQAQLFRPLWPDEMKGRKQSLDRLAKALGNHHDLALFVERIEASRPRSAPLSEIAARVAQRNAAYESEAENLGALLFAEKPSAFVKRLRQYWKVWKASPQVLTSE